MTQPSADRLALLYRISQRFNSSLDLDEVLKQVMDEVIAATRAERGFLMLRDATGQLVFHAARGIERQTIDAPQFQISRGVVERVAHEGLPRLSSDAQSDAWLSGRASVLGLGLRSILCVPIQLKGVAIGVIYVDNRLQAGIFTAADLELLTAIAASAANAIENARLYTNLIELNKSLERFVPREFLQLLGQQSVMDVKLGDHTQMDMSVLFSDIRGFTTLSECMTPQENFDFLNHYLRHVSPVIRAHGGFIDQYYGDGIKALFPQQADDALQSAIGLRTALHAFNLERQQHGQEPIEIGIGLHTSTLMLGTIGEDPRMTVTVIGDAVNTTARLEGLTKLYGAAIIASEQTLQHVSDPRQYHYRYLGKVQVKGKLRPVSIVEVFDGDHEETMRAKLETRADFEEGLRLYQHGEFAAAHECFAHILAWHSSDKTVRLYHERAGHLLTHGAPPDWAGVEVLTEK